MTLKRDFDNVRQDLHERVTAKIVAALEQGIRPWVKPWESVGANGISRPLRHNGIPYNGINVILLWSEAMDKGFQNPIWMSFRQANELGGRVRKGQHGSLVVYADRFTKHTKDDKGEDLELTIPFLKGYTVFNVQQIDGLPEQYNLRTPPPTKPTERNTLADTFIANTGALIRHGGNHAYYSQEADLIQLPAIEQFRDLGFYYSTTMHELSHWTKHPDRLNRDFGRKKWGDEGYAMEELVAELSSAYVCADLGLFPEPPDENAAYIGNWLHVLKNDKRAIFNATSHAAKAAEYLHSKQPKLSRELALELAP